MRRGRAERSGPTAQAVFLVKEGEVEVGVGIIRSSLTSSEIIEFSTP